MTDGWLLWPLIPSAAIVMCLATADYQLASSARTAATISAKLQPANQTVWFQGHGAFQYYMEKLGGRPMDVEQSLLQPGDIMVIPEIGIFTPLPADSVGWVEHFQYAPALWVNLMGISEHEAAGFYGANFGPVPFAIGEPPYQNYNVVEVCCRLQFKTRPINPQAVRAGDMPVFSNISLDIKGNLSVPVNPETRPQIKLAGQLEAEGKIESAIQQYRNVLDLDSNNSVALNQLAWILATTSKPEWRDGKEAVQLAARAVEVTDRRQPRFIGTLAVAYAATGQFSRAAQIAQVARTLAVISSQPDETAHIDELARLYFSGQPDRPTAAP